MAFLLLKNEVKPTVKAAKEISPIKYNFLNLPRLINTAQGDMELWYDATGAKQKKTVTGEGGYTKEYANGVEYEDGELEAIYTGDGRIIYEPATTDDDGNLIPERYRYEFTLSDHLGNARVTFSDLDDDGFITLADNPDTEDVEEPVEMLQENHYYPFGMNMEGSWSPQVGVKNQYQYNGKELNEDLGIDWMDYGARWYDASIGRWTSVDPLATKNSFESPYTFVHNNPLKYIDPDGRDAILVIFPDYKVDTETRLGKLPLGHAGVLLINNETGVTKYYEYGRYATSDGTKGRVRKVTISNVVIDSETGKPTQKSLNKVLGQISKKSGHGGRIEGAYIEGDFKAMNDYAQEKLKESNPQYKEYDKDREPYSLTGNNCGTFGCDVVKQDEKAKEKAPWIFNPTPDNVAEEYRDNFPKIDYNPNKKITTSDIYKKENQ